MAATKRNPMWIEETRKKVQASQLINRLQDHVLGSVELSSTQVRAAEILLKKTLPDLTENKNVNITRRIAELSDGELASIIEGDGSEGTAEAQGDQTRLH
jgi:hypothetical protein